MMLVLAGTAEGREVVAGLSRAGHRIIACAATAYGSRLLEGCGAAEIITGRFNTEEMAELITARRIPLVVDATHPFAEQVTANARRACAATGTIYLRWQRPPAKIPDSPLIHPVPGYPEAAAAAVSLARQVIFLATGAKTLAIFTAAARQAGKKVTARILPDADGLRRCLELGISPGDIIAMQGPFSAQLNKELLSHFKADVLVTKESGLTGGFDAKIRAALELSIPAVVVTRPPAPQDAVDSIEQLLARINARTSP